MSQAAQQVHDGDYANAIQNYQAVIDGSGSSAQKEAASIELALTQWRAGNAQDAIDRFQQFEYYSTDDPCRNDPDQNNDEHRKQVR